jgi:hypothetical protein
MIRYLSMVDLNDYLTLNSNAMVDLVNKKFVPAGMTEELIFKELAGLLMGKFIISHESNIGEQDLAHNVLAMVIIYSIWCGWFSQEKANSGVHPEWVDSFKRLIDDAFEIGQRYSKDQP